MSLAVIGVHGMLSGTATMDFGGRKAARHRGGRDRRLRLPRHRCPVVVPGLHHELELELLAVFLIPFPVIGIVLALRIWKAFPDAKRKGAKA